MLGHIILWGLFCLFLRNAYNAVFTTELISPLEPTSPFHSFMDIINFTFYSPVSEDQYKYYEDPSKAMIFPIIQPSLKFFKESKIKGYAEFANKALQRAKRGQSNLRPLAYSHPSHFKDNLTSPNCRGKAYIDRSERIGSILLYANQFGADKGIQFTRGKEILKIGYVGWTWDNYPDSRITYGLVNRVKELVASGIYQFWEKFYQRFRPFKLFEHYDNKLRQKQYSKQRRRTRNRVHKLDMHSNIATAFVLWGCSILLCLFVLLIEGIKSRVDSSHNKVRAISYNANIDLMSALKYVYYPPK